MKAFDLAAAKAGAPVQTRIGAPARILTFDAKQHGPLVGLVEYMPGAETPVVWDEAGRVGPASPDATDKPYDLHMKPFKARLFIAVADPRTVPDDHSAVPVSAAYACRGDLENALRTNSNEIPRSFVAGEIIEIEVEF